MATVKRQAPIQPGEPAPDFTLPAVHREGTVSLADYRGRSPVLLAMFRGLWCPYCRRQIAQLGLARERLEALGVETLGVVASTPERARLYFRFHRALIELAADPNLITHQAYGLPKPALTPEFDQARQTVRINPTGELPEAMTPPEARIALNRLDGFEPTRPDEVERERQVLQHTFQFTGQFLVDRDGFVRWVNIEGAADGIVGLGKFPTGEELLAAARVLPP
jgi:peroxiredoxin